MHASFQDNKTVVYKTVQTLLQKIKKKRLKVPNKFEQLSI